MARQFGFEVIDLSGKKPQFTVEIKPGIRSGAGGIEPDTEFYVRPPLSHEEYASVTEILKADSFDALLPGFRNERGKYTRLIAPGELNNNHLEIGKYLARTVIASTGASCGIVEATIQDAYRAFLISLP